MQLALICNGMRGRSAGRFDIGFREISSYEQHVQYVIFSPISRYSFSGAGSGYARTCVGPVHGRFARSERARRNGNRCRALNYRRLSESCVVTGAKGNRHPRHVERHIRKRRVLRVRQLLRVREQRRDNAPLMAGHLAADHRLRRVSRYVALYSRVRSKLGTIRPSSRRPAMQCREPARVTAVARVDGRTSKLRVTPRNACSPMRRIGDRAIRKRTSDCPVHRNLKVVCATTFRESSYRAARRTSHSRQQCSPAPHRRRRRDLPIDHLTVTRQPSCDDLDRRTRHRLHMRRRRVRRHADTTTLPARSAPSRRIAVIMSRRTTP